jgi:hypothetical protein
MSSSMAEILGSARVAAMARNTYVWVGLSPSTEGTNSGVTLVAVQSKTGSSSDISTSTNLTQIMAPRLFTNIALVDDASLVSGMDSNSIDISRSDLGSFQAKAGETDRTFSYLIQFSPREKPPSRKAPPWPGSTSA